ncbi:MAG: NUDIX domain-containing protein [Patescibacteria group bacterium UBA2103]
MNGSTSHLFVALGLTTNLKGPFEDLDGPFLNGLGGKIEHKEKITAAAQRECKEECGKLPAKSRLFYCGYVIISNQKKKT